MSRKEEEEIGREKTQEPQREKKDTKTSKNRQDNKPKHVPDGNSISKPKTKTGFWDEAVRKENYRKRKIREEVGHDENKKVARDEETDSESELSSDMEAQIGQSRECLDSGKEETAEMDEAESYAEDQNEQEEFTLYTRGGVQRRRKKRISWERKSTENVSQSASTSNNSEPKANMASVSSQSKQPTQSNQHNQKGKGRGRAK